ncbi:uncharacterized protein LOC131679121 [Topomyia yanbarensis]|uniref:uncharacterized protein LOC131679120 n=1 Tax=Topomyia yanbarensis TaxID=2498891 RepID=UPI00273C92FB|nr:uncharacterized protein LOC131679120 [Topomyia yanbarensis]XP_058815687.1 uncharacterized protein LOC131679120 [Topomyia yanbarensis]XP_058815688.1 uncharacterized protein LOC131679120 [Topomyia yanbarensis]XP_058815690.1 uncharacterized protein LOC131679121 [Topomyia yanbarensis]XP_058815691.1 uncharacterized protein LOC131679121 [Topomyia yanbarensis]
MSSGKNIWQAAATGDPVALQQCLQRKSNKNKTIKVGTFRDNHNWTLLHHAVASRSEECVELLISRTDIDVTARCYEGRTALFLACLKDVPTEIVELLLAKNSALVNVANNENVTPLHVAVERCNVPLVELLVANGANVNATDFAGETPLHSAVEFGSVEILIYLLYIARADASVRSENDVDTLSLLAARGNYDMKTKVACFKILFNHVNIKQQYQQKYLLEDIYAIALLSYRSTSLIPYFVETALLWEKNPSKCRLARELLEGPNDQYLTSRFSDRVNRNLYHFLALLLADDEGIRRLQDDFMNYEVIYSHSLIQNELVALSVAAIRENDNEKKLRMLLEYLDFVKHLAYFFSDHLAETMDMIKNALIIDETDQNEIMSTTELMRYKTIANKIIDITSIEADSVLLRMTSSSTDLDSQWKFFEPIISFCTDVFMNERWLTPANLEKTMYSKLLLKYGTLAIVQNCEGFKFEQFSLLRQSRDTVRKAVWHSIDEDERKRDLIFVRRLEDLEIPRNLIRYLRYT